MVYGRRYRNRKNRSFEIEAVRYGTWDARWYDEATTDVAKFVLGLDVNTRTSILNERMLDVVRPLPKEWNPKRGRADISIFDRGNGISHLASLGDWILRFPDKSLGVCSPEAFRRGYEDIPSG